MLPVERYASLIQRTPTPPPQPVDEDEVSPAGLEEPRRECAERDVNPSRGAGSVRAELVGRSWSSLTRKPPLFLMRSPSGDDGYGTPSLRKEIPSRQPNAVNRIRRDPPPRNKVTFIKVSDPIVPMRWESHSPAGNGEAT